MPLDFVGNVFGAGITAAANIRQQELANEANLQMTRETNAANRELVELQNKAAKEEAELAYKRSSAGNQVNLLRAAGMSRAGAINTLNGGGSYTPAPVNVAQDQAGKVETADLSALANIGQGLAAISERKHQEKMLNKQLAAQKEENQAQRDSNERIAQLQADTTNRNADNRLEFDKVVYGDMAEYRKQQERQLKISNDYEERVAGIKYDTAVENLNLIKANKYLTTTQETKLYEELEDFRSAVEYRNSERETAIAENIVKQLCSATDFNYKSLELSYISSLEGKEREEAIMRAQSWWKVQEARYGIPLQYLVKIAGTLGLLYFTKGAGARLFSPSPKPIGFGR